MDAQIQMPERGEKELLALLKQMRSSGLIKSYCWAFNLEQVLIGIGYFGTAILGLSWTSGMTDPSQGDGISRPTGGSSANQNCCNQSGNVCGWQRKDRVIP